MEPDLARADNRGMGSPIWPRPGLWVAAVGVLAAAAIGCATTRPAAQAPRAAVGTASYYADEHHGRRTANGERFDMNAMTAAHPTLPFGTRVRVTNLANGREVVVRVNDRGPFVKARIIDLSYAAARKLGFAARGTARVRVHAL